MNTAEKLFSQELNFSFIELSEFVNYIIMCSRSQLSTDKTHFHIFMTLIQEFLTKKFNMSCEEALKFFLKFSEYAEKIDQDMRSGVLHTKCLNYLSSAMSELEKEDEGKNQSQDAFQHSAKLMNTENEN